ncbi:glutathione S-transferase family protein [Lysobacter sp. CFH 32150]|uniref:glutathione S-transferase family protein n=1 Tax=Lysobacter sp. CFH 32150 TaxID=2927128 RepID=UPI001FA7B87E|nr:glutathione S-transferase family protein [Lysobacter sp. CFH 32150]MCI4567855.1 glutathione S-transferase family protein [Lysobacter sp. CFH 32150]
MPLLVIGNKNYSSWSLRPWLLLRQFDIAFEERKLNLDTPEFFAEIGKWSPTARVPVLHDDGLPGGNLVVWDTLAICEYINERWLAGRGWPTDMRARAQARSAVAEMHSGFGALRSQLPMNVRRKPNGYRGNAAVSADVARIEQLWQMLRANHGAGGEFLCGDFGIVDAMFAPVVMRFTGYGVEVGDNAARYMEALNALPGMREWRAASEAEPEHLAPTDNIGRQ